MRLDQRTEDQLRILTDSRNRAICDIVDETGGSLHVTELAERLVSQDVIVVSEPTYIDQIDRMCLELHHERLPKLADVHLLEYDPHANLVTPRSSTPIDVEWHDDASLEELLPQLSTNSPGDEDTIGTINGHESVFEYALQLTDEATKELFCLFITPDLLKEKCFHSGENAFDRGVSIYIGSRNAAVRQVTRHHLPEATIWEPQLDWMNTPKYPRVGRLILMDRLKVMLSIFEEPPPKGASPKETALVGNGEDNPLVVLVRELLGPRLDHLDYQSDEFRSKLPSGL